MKYHTELISKEMIAEGTMTFHFKKPEGFVFRAGQTVDITLIDPPVTDAEGNMRTFSIAAAPHEPDLFIATRMRDTAFKTTLRNAQPGFKIDMEGPIGSFTLHQKETRPAIMLVGGIGITPFISMIKDATERKLPHQIYLFYSNRRPEDAAFLSHLRDLALKNPHFTFIPTMTDMEKSAESWPGERGYITHEMIKKYVSATEDSVYYSAGPASMVAAMRKIVTQDMAISEDDFKTEEFTGY
jgi:ferredoxin-NADP reductase